MDICGWMDACHQAGFFPGHVYVEVACLDLEALALNREINSCSSLIFSSFFLLASFICLIRSWLDSIPEVIVSGIQLNFSVINVCGMCADFVQKVTVMGYNNDGIVKVDQEFFKPFDSIGRSRWLVGSSRSRMSGFPKSACARSTLTFWLPVRSAI